VTQPMLCKLGDKSALNNGRQMIYELKKDGVRCIAHLNSSTVLEGRSGKDITAQFPELKDLHKQVRHPCDLDGEIMGVDFNAIQHRINLQNALEIRLRVKKYPCMLWAFDILQVGGRSIENNGLMERKTILNREFQDAHSAAILPWTEDGVKLHKITLEQGLEGVVAKDKRSPYCQGKRSPYWLKIKNFHEATFFVVGMTVGENARSDTFGALILAEQRQGKLVYVGSCGTGFDNGQLQKLRAQLGKIEGKCPIQGKPDKPVLLWARPELKAQVQFLERTGDGMLRFPSFRKIVK